MDEGLKGGTKFTALLRNKKIIVVVLVVLLLLVGGGILLWQNTQSDENVLPTQQSADGIKEKYNSYTNYVLFGRESNEVPSLEAIEEAQPYFMSLEGGEKNAYLEQAELKFDELQGAYAEYGGDLVVNLETLEQFFQDLAQMQGVTMIEMTNLYVSGGDEAVNNLIIERFSSNETNVYFDDYLNAEREYAQLMQRIIANANAAGCINGGQLVEGCYVLTEAESVELASKLNGVLETKSALQYNAMETLETIYDYLYGTVDEEEDA